jgi:hypothetical protein
LTRTIAVVSTGRPPVRVVVLCDPCLVVWPVAALAVDPQPLIAAVHAPRATRVLRAVSLLGICVSFRRFTDHL